MTLPHKGKMLWYSYFRSFIKSINFSRSGNFVKNFNFVSTPWKIIIPLRNSVGALYGLYKCIWVGNEFFTPKCHFLTISWKKLDSGWSSQKKIFGFPYLSLKLSLTLFHKGKMLWCSYFRSFTKSKNISRTGNFIKKFNFVALLGKL